MGLLSIIARIFPLARPPVEGVHYVSRPRPSCTLCFGRGVLSFNPMKPVGKHYRKRRHVNPSAPPEPLVLEACPCVRAKATHKKESSK